MYHIEKEFVGTTFEDFIRRPQKGILESRRDPNRGLLEMPLTSQLNVRVPIVSANMDTVTGRKMAAGMALEGGVSVLPRQCSVERQVSWIEWVKRRYSFVIDNPATISSQQTIQEALQTMKANKVSGLLVVDQKNKDLLVGILSHRDIPSDDMDGLVSKCMTPRHQIVYGELGISMRDAEQLMFQHRVEKLPILELTPNHWSSDEQPPSSQESILRGLMTKRDIQFLKSHPYSSRDIKGRLLVGGTIGVKTDRWGHYMERAEALIAADVDFILIDIAHGHSENMERAIKVFRSKYRDFPLVAGNVATYEGARFLVDLRVDAIKVGIGPGHGCRTRLETGFGVPQMQAIREVHYATRKTGIPFWADGGMEEDFEISHSLLAGASVVMLGGVLAGTDESPGALITDPATGQPMKDYRGMTSPEVLLDGIDPEQAEEILQEAQSQEGQRKPVPYRGPLAKVIKRICDHLCSVVSYAGTKSLYDAHRRFRENPLDYFIRQTSAAQKESYVR